MKKPRLRDTHEPVAAVDAPHLHRAAAGFFGGFLLVLALSYLLWRVWLSPATMTPTAGPIPPPPRLQAHPTADLAAERSHQEAHLHGYAWVDRDAGVARIPITRAMQLLVARGTRARPAASSSTGAKP